MLMFFLQLKVALPPSPPYISLSSSQLQRQPCFNARVRTPSLFIIFINWLSWMVDHSAGGKLYLHFLFFWFLVFYALYGFIWQMMLCFNADAWQYLY